MNDRKRTAVRPALKAGRDGDLRTGAIAKYDDGRVLLQKRDVHCEAARRGRTGIAPAACREDE